MKIANKNQFPYQYPRNGHFASFNTEKDQGFALIFIFS